MSTHGAYATVDGRPAVRFERRLRHPVETVWQAVTDPAELAHWFPAAVEVDLRVGGAIAFTFPSEEGAGDVSRGEVVALDPPRRLAFTWDGDLLTFELEPDDAGCVLVFTHLIDDAAAAARNAAGWHVCLDALQARVDGAPAAPPPSNPTPEWERRYAEYQRRGMPAGAPVP